MIFLILTLFVDSSFAETDKLGGVWTDIQNLGQKNVLFEKIPDDLQFDEISGIIEIVSGDDQKFELRVATGKKFLDRRLCPRPVFGSEDAYVHKFPASYGSAVGLVNEDGDPLDIVALGGQRVFQAEANAGVVRSHLFRIIGIVPMEECSEPPCLESQWEQDWKVLVVLSDDAYAHVQDIYDIAPPLLKSISMFWSNYKGPENGQPITRVKRILPKKDALQFLKNFSTIDLKVRKKEIKVCKKFFRTVLKPNDAYPENTWLKMKAQEKMSYRCLSQVFFAPFFKTPANYNKFLKFSSLSLVIHSLKIENANIKNSLKFMRHQKKNKKKHYRFVTYDGPNPGTGSPIFEWVKTKNRNSGCPAGFPDQHYEANPVVPKWEHLGQYRKNQAEGS